MQDHHMIRIGAVLAGLAVAAGAFGAHGLAEQLSDKGLQNWETAARYQMYHALALVACGILAGRGVRVAVAAWCFLGGVVVFAGTLYAMALGGPRFLGAITPIGGTLLILGWLLLALCRRHHSRAL